MRIVEIDDTNQMLSKLNDVNSNFEDKFLKLKSLIEYIESGKCPRIDTTWLSELELLNNELIKFWKITGLNRTDPDLQRVRDLNKRVIKIIKKHS